MSEHVSIKNVEDTEDAGSLPSQRQNAVVLSGWEAPQSREKSPAGFTSGGANQESGQGMLHARGMASYSPDTIKSPGLHGSPDELLGAGLNVPPIKVEQVNNFNNEE